VTRAALGNVRRGLLCVGTLVLLAAGTRPLAATILLFDQQRDATTGTMVIPTTSGGELPGDYGDFVTGAVMAVPGGFFTYGDGGEGFTPNVAVDIYSSTATADDPRVRLWQSDYGDLTNVIFAEGPGTAGAPLLTVLFSAQPGYSVDLYGFDLAGFASDYVIAAVNVSADGDSLFSATNVTIEGDATGPLHTAFTFDEPLSGTQVLLQLDFSNLAPGVQDNIGVDSIRFGQTPPAVPEPGTAVLWLGCAALALALRRGLRSSSTAQPVHRFRKRA